MNNSSDYDQAFDKLAQVVGEAVGFRGGHYLDTAGLPIETQLEVVKIMSILAVAQEISRLNPNNTITYGDGGKLNAWGMNIPD